MSQIKNCEKDGTMSNKIELFNQKMYLYKCKFLSIFVESVGYYKEEEEGGSSSSGLR